MAFRQTGIGESPSALPWTSYIDAPWTACSKIMAILCPVVIQLLVLYMTCLMPSHSPLQVPEKCASLSVTGQHSHRMCEMRIVCL